jgi:DNA-binding CsgD family transcriptional regulator
MGQARRGNLLKLAQAENNVSTALNEAAQWKLEAEAIQKGIADEIDHQMTAWSLTPTEKEVALLLLKGLSLKEISTIRKTAERTVRHHTLAIYQKAGVTGRAELSAFFLEEFLDRQNSLSVITPAQIKARKQSR